MFCTHCGTENPEDALYCARCGRPLPVNPGTQTATEPQAQAFPAVAQLASLWQRVGSFLIDQILQAIPYLGFIPLLINLVLYRRGITIGLFFVKARIVRENGDVSGFRHTFMRTVASSISLLALGLGYFWALWDPKRQTWHDKMLHTYVLRDTPELKGRRATSSTTAVRLFWFLVGSFFALIALITLFWLILTLLAAG